ncbi:hypothetical protein PHMEG_00030619, partial [Phytophthora megakarya]
MLAQYLRIRDAAKNVEDVFDLIPKAAMHRRISAFLADLKVFSNVTVQLQAEGSSLADIRALFDSVISRSPAQRAASTEEHRNDSGVDAVLAAAAAPPTSNRVERLFSQVKLVLTPQRSSLLPVNVELLLFLITNRSYWDV